MSKGHTKRKNRQYSAQKLEDTIEAIKGGELTIWNAARSSGIPYKTLKDKLTGRYESSQIGARSILNENDEQQIVDWIRYRAKLGTPLDKSEVKAAAEKIADRRGLKKFAEKGLSSMPDFRGNLL